MAAKLASKYQSLHATNNKSTIIDNLMTINWNEASTRRASVGLVLFVIGLLILIFDADYSGKITVLLLLGKGISDYLKFTLPDKRE